MGQRTMLGNTTLVEHGITKEESDIRAHVGVAAGVVYVFSTNKALSVVEAGDYRRVPVFSNVNGQRMQTAIGHVVPVSDLSPVELPAMDIISRAGFTDGGYTHTSDKGRKAQWTVEQLLKLGRFPLPAHPSIVKNVDIQRRGFDLVVRGEWRIEVKCDWKAGRFDPVRHSQALKHELTGNIFLQTHECNPLRQW